MPVLLAIAVQAVLEQPVVQKLAQPEALVLVLLVILLAKTMLALLQIAIVQIAILDLIKMEQFVLLVLLDAQHALAALLVHLVLLVIICQAQPAKHVKQDMHVQEEQLVAQLATLMPAIILRVA